MKILINFPRKAHWKHKKKLMDDYNGKYPAVNGDERKFQCVVDCNIRKFTSLMINITSYFPKQEIDYWTIQGAFNFADISITPVRVKEYRVNKLLDYRKTHTYMDNLALKSTQNYNSFGDKI